MTRYVQHKSGIGEKWEVRNECAITWDCTGADNYALYLPKSEYVEVPAPDRWVDVTADCEPIPSEDDIAHHGHVIISKLGYRLRRLRLFDHGQHQDGTAFQPVEQWAFIVERKEP